MSLEQFAQCYADQVGTTVDSVLEDLQNIGEENIRKFVEWLQSLSDRDRLLLPPLATVFAAVLTIILTKVVGEFAALCFIALLGGASWALLTKSFLHCYDVL